jgi:hypothetical protein
VFCEALSDGSYFLKGSSAPGLRDAKALVADSDTEDCPGALGAVFSVVTLFAHQQKARMSNAARRAVWYEKAYPTFSDALVLERRELWAHSTFAGRLGRPTR